MGDSIKNQFVGSTLNNPLFIYGEKKIPKHLGNLPFPPELFLGREDDLVEVHRKLFGKENVLLLINGQGGIGKTTFASKYYHRYAEEYAHMAWVFAEKNLADALLLLAAPLQVSFEETMPAEARLIELLKAMAELEKPCLLVVDNANKLSELERNYQALRSCPNFHVLLTTRITDLSNAAFHPLGTLGREDARQLFRKYYPAHETQEDGLLDQILKAVGYNTLVIELLAKNLRQSNNRLKKRYPLSQLLEDLTHKGLFGIRVQEVSTSYQARDLGMRQETPEAIIATMYDLGELQKDEQTILSVLSVLPAETIAYGVLEEIFSELEELDKLLLGLSASGWLEYNQDTSSFKISPVVQEVVRSKNRDVLWENCRSLITILNFKLNFEPGTGHLKNSGYEEAALWATNAEFAGINLLPWFQNHLPEEDELAGLFDRLGYFHFTIGDLLKALLYFQNCEKLFLLLCDSYPQKLWFKHGLAVSYERLGRAHNSLGDLDKALGYFEQYYNLEQELHNSHPHNVEFKNALAISYLNMGITHSSLGNLEKALWYYEQYYKLEQEIYSSHPQDVEFKNNLAISYSKLGETHSSLGNLEKALGYFEEDLRISEELHSSHPQNVEFKHGLAVSYLRLGNTHTFMGNLKKALRYFEQNNNLEQELHSSHPQDVLFKNHLAISYLKLGGIHSFLGNLKKALGYLEQYYNLERELHSSHPQNVDFKNNLAISYQHLGNTHSSLGNLEKALEYFMQYNNLEQELHSSHPQNMLFKINLAVSYQFLGWLYANEIIENTKAKEFYIQAKSLLVELYADFPDLKEYKDSLDWTEEALKRVE